jgi:hypothetical protein
MHKETLEGWTIMVEVLLFQSLLTMKLSQRCWSPCNATSNGFKYSHSRVSHGLAIAPVHLSDATSRLHDLVVLPDMPVYLLQRRSSNVAPIVTSGTSATRHSARSFDAMWTILKLVPLLISITERDRWTTEISALNGISSPNLLL